MRYEVPIPLRLGLHLSNDSAYLVQDAIWKSANLLSISQLVSLANYQGVFHLFTRGNASAKGGYRCITWTTSEDLLDYSPLQKLVFEGLDEADNIYYAHPVTIENKMALIMPIARVDPSKPSGIFIAFCNHDNKYRTPVLLLASPIYNCRTADVNAAGAVASTLESGQTFLHILVHRNVPFRCKRKNKQEEALEWWEWDLSELMQDLYENEVHMSVELKNKLRQLLQDAKDTQMKPVSNETAEDEQKRGFWTHLEEHPLVIAAHKIRKNLLLSSHRSCDDFPVSYTHLTLPTILIV